MEYLNLHTSVLDSAEFLGADTVERGTWLSLLRYCIGQENSGVIEDCANWKDRQWQQVSRVTLREVRRKSRLFRWEGNDLRVFYYPVEVEAQIKTKRLVAQANGKMGGRPVKNPSETQPKPTLVISEKAKGNEMKGNEMNTPQPPFRGSEGGGDDGLILRIKRLRKEWGELPILSAREMRVFVKNRGLLEIFPEDAWEVLREFLAARLPEGPAYFQPVLLVKFLENPGGVWGQAKAWKEKQRPRFEVVVPAGPVGAPATAAERAEIFAALKPKRMNS